MSHDKFIPGLILNKRFFFEIIKPLIESAFPDLNYSAALIGYGSDVLGYDNPTSMDHNWGPRCQIFLDENSLELKEQLAELFRQNLPFSFEGFPTNYTAPQADLTQAMRKTTTYPVHHLIEIEGAKRYFEKNLGIENIEDLTKQEWIELNDQALLELTEGEVFHDGLGTLTRYRQILTFFPPAVVKLRLASLWMMIANEEAFVGRCIELDDLIGLKLITSRIITALLKILFYLENQYIPYSKWFGTKLRSLKAYPLVEPFVHQILIESNPGEINAQLKELYQQIIAIHNQQPDLPELHNTITAYYGRPYQVIQAESIAETLINSLEDPELREINVEKIALDLKIDSVDFTG
jgi:hypothetical protein